MSQPKITITDPSGINFLGPALALYRQYDTNQTFPRSLQYGPAIMLFRQDDLKIVMQLYNYALFSSNPATLTFYSLFNASVPTDWAVTGGLLPSLPTFFPINPSVTLPWPVGICVPLYNELTNYITGQATVSQTITFQNPILSSTSPLQSLEWVTLKMQLNPTSGNYWYLTTYQLQGGGVNVNVTPISMKVLIASPAQVNLFEYDAQGPVLLYMSLQSIPTLFTAGIFFRRLLTSGPPLVEQMFAYVHNSSTYSGALYLVGETSGALTFTTEFTASAGGRANPPGSPKGTPTVGSLYTDNTLDIFTSESSQWYYVVNQTINTATDYNMGFSGDVSDPYACDTYLFPGMSLSVTQYNKATMAAGATWTLNPSSADTTLQGFTQTIALGGGGAGNRVATNNQLNAANKTFFAPNLPVQTSFVFQQGFVLVDADGSEYPLVSGVSLTQGTYDTEVTVFCQPVILWLGGSLAGGYTWPGVQAVGLGINGALAGIRNDCVLGELCYPNSGIGSSTAVLLPVAPQLTQTTWGTDTYLGASCRVVLGPAALSAGDRTGYGPEDQFFIDNVPVYTVPTGGITPSPSVVLLAIAAVVNAAGVYTATNMSSFSEDSTTFYTFILTRVDGQANMVALGYTSAWGFRLEQRILSIAVVDAVPVVTLVGLQQMENALALFDI